MSSENKTLYGVVNKKTKKLFSDVLGSRDTARYWKICYAPNPKEWTVTKFKVQLKEVARGQ